MPYKNKEQQKDFCRRYYKTHKKENATCKRLNWWRNKYCLLKGINRYIFDNSCCISWNESTLRQMCDEITDN